PFTLAEPFARVPLKQAVLTSLERAGLGGENLVEKLPSLAFETKTGKPADPAIDALVERFRGVSERAKAVDWRNLRRALAHAGSDGERLFVAYEYLAEPFLAEDYRSKEGNKS